MTVTVTVRQLAEWVSGEVLGDADLPIANARSLAEAEPGDITFVEAGRNLDAWHASRASAAVVPTSVPVNGRPIIRVPDPLMAFVSIVQHLRGRSQTETHTIDSTAIIHPTARLAPDVSVGPFVAVGEGAEIGANTMLHCGVVIGRGCRIGANCVLYPRVVLYDDCVVHDRVIIHANAVIGADGFGYRFQDGRHNKVPQLGWVEIEDDVEIGAGATIDRGTFGATRIGQGTKLDNLVQIGHNCVVGRHNVFAAQVGIAGSCTTGDYVVMGGQAGIADHTKIGNRAMIGAQSGVRYDVPDGVSMYGSPASTLREELRMIADLKKLHETIQDVRRIKQHVGLCLPPSRPE